MADVPSPVRTSRIVLAIVIGAIVGLAIFGRLAYQAVDVEQVGRSEALTRFAAARDGFRDQAPMLEVDAEGRVSARRAPPPVLPQDVSRLKALAYWSADERLVLTDVPFWFFRLKRPALQFALRGTGLDLDRLGLTAEDLARQGPSLVLDEARANGDRLLVWTE
jgi:hypothetical protein